MSYDVSFRGAKFFLWNMNKWPASEALIRYNRDAILHKDSCYDKIADGSSFEEILAGFGWHAETDAQGNVSDIWFDDCRLGDEDTWMEQIAPYVRKGSWISMEGEDGHIWCWYFDGEHCTTHTGHITFPSIPDGAFRKDVDICT